MAFYSVVNKNGQKALANLAGATRGEGCPLGMWASFENDIAPNSNWIKAGETFDATLYPALALYLGGNTVPERFDHSRLGAYESFTYTSDVAQTMQYDGVLVFNARNTPDNTGTLIVIKINGETIVYDWNRGAYQYTTSTITLDFNKGDVIEITASRIANPYVSVAYYKHPLFIKATSNMNESEATALINSIQERIGEVFKTDIHDFGSNPTTWGSGFEYTFEETVPVGKYRVHAIIPNDSNGDAIWSIMIHSGDVSTSYEGITNWTTGWDILVGNYTSGNLEGTGQIVSQNHKGTIIECGTMKVKTPLTKLQVGASTAANITSPNKVQIVLERIF